jgi:hypothetical protein
MKFAKSLFFLFCFYITLLTSCERKNIECEAVKNGRFHVYTPDGRHFLIIRKDSIQLEVNQMTGDTSHWKVKWLTNCDFNAQYISGGKMESQAQEEFYKKTLAQFSVQKVATKYYVFTGSIKTPQGYKTYTDTTWLQEK